MIKKVELTSPTDGDSYVSIAVETIHWYEDYWIERKLTAIQGCGPSSSNNPEGTDDKIEVRGQIDLVEVNGKMEISKHSQQDIDDIVAVFKIMFLRESEGSKG